MTNKDRVKIYIEQYRQLSSMSISEYEKVCEKLGKKFNTYEEADLSKRNKERQITNFLINFIEEN